MTVRTLIFLLCIFHFFKEKVSASWRRDDDNNMQNKTLYLRSLKDNITE